ncbi:MAG: DedA family protein [Chloroflexi bacterium]|uniref:DedA family protein n=1 Tax=Candidatus Chlorohelix allophototropha TaxID=3003348 RepID=A0A8T7M227_9CHLR|nr:DedA family protein [Chloroflexota bacterium]WJW66857.1 DedA family protein [Chloroflexota bacterium L227-S17]
MLKGLENWLIDFLTTFYHSVGWWGVIAMMAIESMMIPLPSEIIMPLAGWLLVTNIAGDTPVWLQLVWAGVIGGVGCTIGSIIGYYIGLFGGRPLVVKYGKYVLINVGHLEIAERWLDRWGALATFISRLLPVVRTFVSLPAGVVRTHLAIFLPLTFIGSFIWSLALAWVGFVLGAQFESVRNSIGWLDYPIIAVILLLVVWFVYNSLKKRKQERLAASVVGGKGKE